MSLAERVAQPASRILIVDIERLPGLTPIWDQKTSFMPVSKWTRLPSLLCFAAKWYGSKRIMFHAAWDDHAAMVETAWELYDQADIVVTYNGIRFDNRHLKSDWLVAGMPPPSPWKDVDLYAVNRSTFGFESKSLDHLCHRLGLDRKAGHYDLGMAERCMDGDPRAQRTMRRYNQGDVKITEQAYDRLRGWIPSHPHALYGVADETPTCNQCWPVTGGRNLQYRGVRLADQISYSLFRCLDCGANVSGTRHARVAITRGVR